MQSDLIGYRLDDILIDLRNRRSGGAISLFH